MSKMIQPEEYSQYDKFMTTINNGRVTHKQRHSVTVTFEFDNEGVVRATIKNDLNDVVTTRFSAPITPEQIMEVFNTAELMGVMS